MLKKDITYIESILEKNKDKNFVQRIKNPKLRLGNEDGSYSTHSMAWGQVGNQSVVFPTVVESQKGKLKRLEMPEAWVNALTNGESISFNTPEEADWFSKNYKNVWKKKK